MYSHSRVRERNAQEIEERKLRFWFVATLFLGVLLRLFGWLPSYEFDLNEDGTQKEVVPDEESDLKRIAAIRRILRACFVLSFGMNIDISIDVAFRNDDGTLATGSVDARHMLEEYGESGSTFAGWDVSEVMRRLESNGSPDVYHKDFKSIGLPRASEDWSPDFRSSESFKEALQEAKVLSPSRQLFHLVSRLRSCACLEESYFHEQFPFSSSPLNNSASSTDLQMRELATVLVFAIKRLFVASPVCSACGEKVRYHSAARRGFVDVLSRNVALTLFTEKNGFVQYTERGMCGELSREPSFSLSKVRGSDDDGYSFIGV